jgi:hypothetical protein
MKKTIIAINKALITLSYGRIVSTSCHTLGLCIIIVDNQAIVRVNGGLLGK